MRRYIKFRLFSLVELLIVIAILAILMSLFVPALQTTMYRAKNTKCMNTLKTITTGLIMYAEDNYDHFPHRGAIRNDLESFKNSNIWDIVPILKPYFDGDLSIFNCPLNAMEVNTNSKSAYALYFKTRNSVSTGSTIGDLGDRVIQYRVNGQILGHLGSSSMMRTWYYSKLEGILNKLGETWRNASTGEYYDILISDRAGQHGGLPNYRRWSNHNELSDIWKIETNSKIWSTPNYSYLYPYTSMNCAKTDGSVKTFIVPERNDPNFSLNFTTISRQFLPYEYRVK
jgi:prepilin-type N-terminal cleavage/methylation domain-containing protein